MEAQEDYNQVLIKQMMIKGKRTKRHRAQPHASVSSLALSIDPSCSSSSGCDVGGGGGELVLLDGVTTSSDDQSAEVISRREEEEDMANCLILLAQGRDRHDHHDHHNDHRDGTRNSKPRQVNDAVYQCKTCDRCFPSFQALGGHRASHKKPKTTPGEKKTMSFEVQDRDQIANSATSTTLSLQITNRGILGNGNNNDSGANGNNNSNKAKAKVHECLICGAEFMSGQALGGHMRRHRVTSFVTAPTATPFSVGTTSGSNHERESKKPRNVLQLDLNLPAPKDDRQETKFPFSGKEQVIVFAASPLVDCHY